MFKPQISAFGDHAINLSWEAVIDPQTHKKVLDFEAYLCAKFGHSILETVSTYNSLVVFLKQGVNLLACIADFEKIAPTIPESTQHQQYIWQIPVCYDPYFGLDLDTVAQHANLSVSEIIKKHTAPHYRVYFNGFLPGFPYLGGLDEKLYMPRKATPRLIVPQGSVGIGGNQTGIYPSQSPGGWQIIGQSPVRLFDVNQHPPTGLKAGDEVVFFDIDRATFEQLTREVNHGTYIPLKTKMV